VPVITSISPSSGHTGGGISVTITGTSLNGATSVTFEGQTASIDSNSATQIVVTNPSGSAGYADIAVTTPGGTDTELDGFFYIPTTTISSVSPSRGSTDSATTGVVITASSSDARYDLATSVTVGGTAATITAQTTSTVTATFPAKTAGTYDVAVTTPGATTTQTDAFTYGPPPTITIISPPYASIDETTDRKSVV
jgi:hypothetical protein